MSWRVVVRPEAQDDVAEAAEWYEARTEELGNEFREAVIQVLDALADNPFLNCRQHPRRNIRWRYPHPTDEPVSRLWERIKATKRA